MRLQLLLALAILILVGIGCEEVVESRFSKFSGLVGIWDMTTIERIESSSGTQEFESYSNARFNSDQTGEITSGGKVFPLEWLVTCSPDQLILSQIVFSLVNPPLYTNNIYDFIKWSEDEMILLRLEKDTSTSGEIVDKEVRLELRR